MPTTSTALKSVSGRARMENMAYLRLDPHYSVLEKSYSVAMRKALSVERKATKESWAMSNSLPPGPKQDQLRHARSKTVREEKAWNEVRRLRAELAERRAYLEQVSDKYAG